MRGETLNLIVFMGFGAWALGWSWWRWRRRTTGPLVRATVLGHRQVRTRNDESPHEWDLRAILRFETVEGRGVHSDLSVWKCGGGAYPIFHTGEEVWIRYDPADPAYVMLDQGAEWSWRELLPTRVTRSAVDARPPATVEQLRNHLLESSATTPYRVRVVETYPRTEFTIELALGDPRWQPAFRRHGITRTFTVHARADPGTRRITLHTPTAEDFGKQGRLLEFGDNPESLHAFTAAEAVGWLWRQAREIGFEPRADAGARPLETLGMMAGAVAGGGLLIWGAVAVFNALS